MLDQETKRRIDSARNILVGKVPDPKAQVDQITTALIYKFMDDIDQESRENGGNASYFIGEFKKYSWPKIIEKKLSGQERLDLYIQAINQIPTHKTLPSLFKDVFKNAFLPYRDAETLSLFLKEIDWFSYDDSENLGNAFEYLLSILGSQGDAGQFRTPRHIIDFIVEVLDPKKNESVLDPACGTGGFLISSYKHIVKNNSRNYDPKKPEHSFERSENDGLSIQIQSNGRYEGKKLKLSERKQLQKNFEGYDISPDMVKLALVNMYLHKFKEPKIFEYDTLTSDNRWGNDFDVVLANPPFMTPKGGIRPHNRFSVRANRSEVLFVDYIAEHLKLNGRAGIIVPEGIIFKSDKAYKALRKMLVERSFLWAVVSLPAKVFEPYSGVKTSILFLDRKRAKKSDEILFVNVQNDGFELGATRRKIDENDLPEAFRVLKSWSKENKEKSEVSFWCKKKKIIDEGSWNLSGNLYRPQKKVVTKWPMVKLGDVCEIYQPKTISQKEMSSSGKYVVFGANGPIGKYDKYNHEESEVLVTCRGATCGNINISEKQSWITGNAMVIKPIKEKELNKKFIFNLLIEADLSKIISGSAQPQITRQNLSPFQIPLPPLSIQKEIVAEIDGYQKIIDGAKQVVENWKPTFKIDPKWPMVKLGDVCNFINGKAFKPSDWEKESESGIPIIRIQNLNNPNASFNYYSKKIDDTYLVNKGDLLFSWSGSKGTSFGSHIWDKGMGILNQHIFKVEHSSKYIRKFLHLSLKKVVSEVEKNLHGGVGLVHITKGNLEKIQIPLPPLSVQKEIVAEIEKEQDCVSSCKKLIEINENKIKKKIEEVWNSK